MTDQYVRPPTEQRERQALEAEAGTASAQDCEQVVAGPVCVSPGGGVGQTRSLVDACAFAQQQDGTISAIWRDDLIGSGKRTNMEAMKEKLRGALECNTGRLVGVDADLAKETTFTKRTIRCILDACWELNEAPEDAAAVVSVRGRTGQPCTRE